MCYSTGSTGKKKKKIPLRFLHVPTAKRLNYTLNALIANNKKRMQTLPEPQQTLLAL